MAIGPFFDDNHNSNAVNMRFKNSLTSAQEADHGLFGHDENGTREIFKH